MPNLGMPGCISSAAAKLHDSEQKIILGPMTQSQCSTVWQALAATPWGATIPFVLAQCCHHVVLHSCNVCTLEI